MRARHSDPLTAREDREAEAARFCPARSAVVPYITLARPSAWQRGFLARSPHLLRRERDPRELRARPELRREVARGPAEAATDVQHALGLGLQLREFEHLVGEVVLCLLEVLLLVPRRELLSARVRGKC